MPSDKAMLLMGRCLLKQFGQGSIYHDERQSVAVLDAHIHSKKDACSSLAVKGSREQSWDAKVSVACTGDGVQGFVRWALLNMLSGWKQSTCLGHYIQIDEKTFHLQRFRISHIVKGLVGKFWNLLQ